MTSYLPTRRESVVATSLRLPKSLVEAIDEIAQRSNVSRSHAMEHLLTVAVEEASEELGHLKKKR